jgi:hypothetical protein
MQGIVRVIIVTHHCPMNQISQNMGKIRPGSKINSILNGEWAKHVKAFGKKNNII